MCKPVTLHYNKQGCVSWCSECNHINVAFGTMAIALTVSQFFAFKSVLNADLKQRSKQPCCCGKIVMYNTDSRNVNIILNYVELIQLASLMNYSALMFDAYRIIYQE